MASPDIPTDWEEARYVAALSRLENLQEQLNELRLTVPRIIRPLTTPHQTPSGFYANFRRAAYSSSRDLEKFRTAWYSQDVQDILERATYTRNIDPDLSMSTKLPRYGWGQRNVTQVEGMEGTILDMNGHNVQSLQEKDLRELVEKFAQEYNHFDIQLELDTPAIKIQIIAHGLVLKFIVQLAKDSNGYFPLHAECCGSTKLFAAITSCLASRPHQNDLVYLLYMIAAYVDTRMAVCTKCGKLLDQLALPPAARRSKEDAQPDDATKVTWEALHETCLND